MVVSKGSIPRSPTWCTRCIANSSRFARGTPEGDLVLGLTAVGERKLDEPCPDHRGKDGRFVDYKGYDAYEPSEWVLTVVGKRYRGFDGRVYLCFGYDPRSGFWMRAEGEPAREANVSEAAIDRTYHRVREPAAPPRPAVEEEIAPSEDRRDWAAEDKHDLEKEGGWEDP